MSSTLVAKPKAVAFKKSATTEKKDPNACKVLVSNLDYSTIWSELRDMFAEVGIVEYAKVYMNQDDISTGRGYVQFKSEKKAEQAVEKMNGKELGGRKIIVKRFPPKN